MPIVIRPLADNDLETADEILKLAFRGSVSRLRELQLYRQIQPDGWLLALHRGRPIGVVGATNYGKFAYVGLMAVHPDVHRQGVGLALMQSLLARLDQQYVPVVLLDASEAGQPLYQKLGFVIYDETLTLQRHGNFPTPGPPHHVPPLVVGELDELIQRDEPIFGANRGKVFRVLFTTYPDRAFILRDEHGQMTGYLFAQKNRIGPWVMHQEQGAEALLQAALALSYEEEVSVTLPAVNQQAIELLEGYGFEPVRSNQHMGRGQGAAPSQRKKIYAQTNLAIG